jgi:hypothetical protein
MELIPAFKTIPEELYRIIIDYARPIHPYLTEFKLAKNFTETQYYYSAPLTHYLNTITHKKTFMNYRIYGEYVRHYGGEWVGEYYDVMCELQEEYNQYQ